jgi:integrase
VERNKAMLRQARAHVRIKYLEADFAGLFCYAMAGLGEDGREDPGFRGRFPGRNSAVTRLALSTGMRRREFSHLLVYEVPPLPRQPTQVPVLFPVPPLAAKGRKARTTWIDYDVLAAVHDYIGLERALGAVRWRPADPLEVRDPDLFGARVNGRRTSWSALTPGDRLRLVASDGGSCLLARDARGGPFTDWGTLFRRTSRRVRGSFEPRFPDVSPHRLRHSFAMATLERLVSGHYRRAAEVVSAAGADAGLALYLAKADPLMILRDLLGHSSVSVTEIYLKRLDVGRIYRAAYERAGTGLGLADPAVFAEADAEFSGEGDLLCRPSWSRIRSRSRSGCRATRPPPSPCTTCRTSPSPRAWQPGWPARCTRTGLSAG